MPEENTLQGRLRQIESQKSEVLRKRRRYRVHVLLFVAAFILGYTILGVIDGKNVDLKVSSYLKSTDEKLDNYIDIPVVNKNYECYTHYSDMRLGLSNNNALAGLSIYCDANRDFYNVYGEITAYRDVETGNAIIKNGKEEIYRYNGSIREMILTKERLFFVDENGNLKMYDLQNKKEETVKGGIKGFAVYGKYIIVLDDNNTLIRIGINSGEELIYSKEIQSFYSGNYLIAQNGTSIVRITLDRSEASVACKNAFLIGCAYDKIYYYDVGEDNRLDGNMMIYSCDLTGTNMKEVASYSTVVSGVYEVNGDAVFDVLEEGDAHEN